MDIEAKIAKMGAVNTFVGVVPTGSGATILNAAHAPKRELEKPANT